MNFRRRVLDYTLAGLLLLVPALILNSSLKDPQDLNRFDHAVLRVSSPLQSAVSWVVEGVGGIWHGYVWLVDVEDENEELRLDNERLRRQLATARQRAADVELLEELVGLRRRVAAETVGARVVAASLTPAFRVVRVRVDRGEHEVKPDMPVVNSRGLVGRILHAYGDYSDVILLTDAASKIPVVVRPASVRDTSDTSDSSEDDSAGSLGAGAPADAAAKAPDTDGKSGGAAGYAHRTQRLRGHGVLRGLADSNTYGCQVASLEGEEVQVGFEVVTSGLGQTFPPGLLIGYVRSVERAGSGLFQTVYVTPAVDFSDLGALLVLVAQPPPRDPNRTVRTRSRRALDTRPF